MFTNLGLVAYAEAMLDYMSPYWFGTWGNMASEQLYISKSKQYPEQYNKWSKSSFSSQYGKKVHDCSGLEKGYKMNPTLGEDGYVKDPLALSVYMPQYDISANALEAKAKEKGLISTIPEIPGLIVWKSGHQGIYVGNGWVIEERGHTYGTVKTKLSDRPWVKWLKDPDIKYITETPKPAEGKCMVELDILKKGSKGRSVKSWQILMNGLGFKDKDGKRLEEDGSFGGKTEYATNRFKRYYGLTVDGIVDSKTWTKAIEG